MFGSLLGLAAFRAELRGCAESVLPHFDAEFGLGAARGPAGAGGAGAAPHAAELEARYCLVASAFIICCAIVSPAPSPTPMPATPPPSFAAAIGIDCAT